VSQFELIPELAGNPFLPRLFQMFDANQDGRISLDEFTRAMDFFLQLQSAEDKKECALTCCVRCASSVSTSAAALLALRCLARAQPDASPLQLSSKCTTSRATAS